MMAAPARGFDGREFDARLAQAQSRMAKAGLQCLLLTTEPEIRYFTGFLTRFWESPTRPWFLVVPVSGPTVAVIPSIGADLMSKCRVGEIRTWRSPDLTDDGVTLLADTLTDLAEPGDRIGIPAGHESHLRMPLDDWARLEALLAGRTLTGDAGIMRAMRMVKSKAEITKIRQACRIADSAFEAVPEFAGAGTALDEIFRRFQMACLDAGADWVSYLAGGAGPDGYGDVISPATEKPLQTEDILMLDTGLVWDGYFCDFDRNFAVGKPSTLARDAHSRLIEATAAGFEAARPGAIAADLFHAMNRVLTGGKGQSDAGRLGHGLGMQLTEWPSLIPEDETPLEPGMVLTLEPGIETAQGRMMVHEENIVITEQGAEYLSTPAGPDLPVI